jgi:hypothetical protein
VRSAERIRRTPEEWKELEDRRRARIARELQRLLDRAFTDREPWYVWILNGMPRLTPEEYEDQKRRQQIIDEGRKRGLR